MKIASGHWAGLEVSLRDESKVALPEYPPEDVTPDGPVSKHVECKNDQERFSIEVQRSANSIEAVDVLVKVDGRQIDHCIMNMACKEMRLEHFNEREGGQVVSKYLKFGLPEISEDGPRPDPRLLEHLGTVAITLLGGTSVKLDQTPHVSYVAEQAVMGPKAKKVLESFVIGEHRGAASTRGTSFFIRDFAIPALTLTFHYRSKERLEGLGIIPTVIELPDPVVQPKAEVTRKRKASKKDKEPARLKSGAKKVKVEVKEEVDDKIEIIDLTK